MKFHLKFIGLILLWVAILFAMAFLYSREAESRQLYSEIFKSKTICLEYLPQSTCDRHEEHYQTWCNIATGVTYDVLLEINTHWNNSIRKYVRAGNITDWSISWRDERCQFNFVTEGMLNDEPFSKMMSGYLARFILDGNNNAVGHHIYNVKVHD